MNRVEELDKNMDTVYDNLFVLNAVIGAMVNCLPLESAEAISRQLDQRIDGMRRDGTKLGPLGTQMMHAWRNEAARLAGIALRRPG
ncbi:MAG: hypothetical protein C4516_04280 [Oxalobacter sp.]|nr:MAG: hypothetical protein C4516_04280 [Oxalobacter sp.]